MSHRLDTLDAMNAVGERRGHQARERRTQEAARTAQEARRTEELRRLRCRETARQLFKAQWKLAHHRDGVSAASRPTETFHGVDLAAPRPWAAPCRGCLLLLPMRMKVLGPCLLKLKKQLSQRSSPRRPWRGRRVRRPLFGPGRRLAKIGAVVPRARQSQALL